MDSASAITIHVPHVLRSCCGGARELLLSAPTVRAALAEIERLYPSLYRGVCDETGAVRRHVNLFVNNLHMRDREGLDTALSPGDTITIMPAVSGGEKGVGTLLCEAPSGPFRQKGPDPFFASGG